MLYNKELWRMFRDSVGGSQISASNTGEQHLLVADEEVLEVAFCSRRRVGFVQV